MHTVISLKASWGLCNFGMGCIIENDFRLAIAPELFELQGLTRLALGGFEGNTDTLCHLSNLRVLPVYRGLDEVKVPGWHCQQIFQACVA